MAWRAAPVDVAEDQHLQVQAEPLLAAINVALAKARAASVEPDELVVAADTLVVLDREILGKPDDAESARAMLRRLRDRAHEVVTGVVVRTSTGREWAGAVATQVQMRPYSDTELTAYVSRGEPFDKAGGYAIQDVEFAPVARIDACYLNVVGLPLCAVAAGLEAGGFSVEQPTRRAAPCSWCETGAPRVAIRLA